MPFAVLQMILATHGFPHFIYQQCFLKKNREKKRPMVRLAKHLSASPEGWENAVAKSKKKLNHVTEDSILHDNNWTKNVSWWCLDSASRGDRCRVNDTPSNEASFLNCEWNQCRSDSCNRRNGKSRIQNRRMLYTLCRTENVSIPSRLYDLLAPLHHRRWLWYVG